MSDMTELQAAAKRRLQWQALQANVVYHENYPGGAGQFDTDEGTLADFAASLLDEEPITEDAVKAMGVPDSVDVFDGNVDGTWFVQIWGSPDACVAVPVRTLGQLRCLLAGLGRPDESRCSV